jgi:hypothetical protein
MLRPGTPGIGNSKQDSSALATTSASSLRTSNVSNFSALVTEIDIDLGDF